MDLKEIKSSIFGFNKNNVYEYISELNRICSEKVEEARKEKNSSLSSLTRKNEELNNKLVCMESEIDMLKKQLLEKEELIAQLSDGSDISRKNIEIGSNDESAALDIIKDAREFAKQLREKAVKENEAFRAENQRNNEAEKRKLAEYKRSIAEIKASVNAVLSEAKNGLEKAEEKIIVFENKVGG